MLKVNLHSFVGSPNFFTLVVSKYCIIFIKGLKQVE